MHENVCQTVILGVQDFNHEEQSILPPSYRGGGENAIPWFLQLMAMGSFLVVSAASWLACYEW